MRAPFLKLAFSALLAIPLLAGHGAARRDRCASAGTGGIIEAMKQIGSEIHRRDRRQVASHRRPRQQRRDARACATASSTSSSPAAPLNPDGSEGPLVWHPLCANAVGLRHVASEAQWIEDQRSRCNLRGGQVRHGTTAPRSRSFCAPRVDTDTALIERTIPRHGQAIEACAAAARCSGRGDRSGQRQSGSTPGADRSAWPATARSTPRNRDLRMMPLDGVEPTSRHPGKRDLSRTKRNSISCSRGIETPAPSSSCKFLRSAEGRQGSAGGRQPCRLASRWRRPMWTATHPRRRDRPGRDR